MVMLQRLRTKPKVQQAKEETKPPVLRRMRVRGAADRAAVVEAESKAQAAAEKKAEARKRIDELLKSVAKAEAEIDRAQAVLHPMHQEIEKLLRDHNIESHSNGVYRTEIAETFSRQSTDIDPKKFRAEVPEKIFWDCITVGVTKAKEILGEKEVMRIATVVPGKLTGHIYKFSRVKK